jgi:hypothetical protein
MRGGQLLNLVMDTITVPSRGEKLSWRVGAEIMMWSTTCTGHIQVTWDTDLQSLAERRPSVNFPKNPGKNMFVLFHDLDKTTSYECAARTVCIMKHIYI